MAKKIKTQTETHFEDSYHSTEGLKISPETPPTPVTPKYKLETRAPFSFNIHVVQIRGGAKVVLHQCADWKFEPDWFCYKSGPDSPWIAIPITNIEAVT